MSRYSFVGLLKSVYDFVHLVVKDPVSKWEEKTFTGVKYISWYSDKPVIVTSLAPFLNHQSCHYKGSKLRSLNL